MEPGKDLYKIQLLGEFYVTRGEECLSDAAGRMQQVWNLIEYLIVNRHKTIPQGMLMEMLWPDEKSENPANALKNLAYRARTLLSRAITDEERPFIIFRRNTYAWNNELPCEIDIEQMEQAWKEAGSDGLNDEERLERYLRAIGLYQGEFLPKSVAEEWTMSLRTYYSSIFTDCIARAFDLLIQRERFDEAVMICEKAVSLEKYSEKMHELLICA